MIKVHFLNVGHGDCTIIEHDSNHLTMIDINNSKNLPSQDMEALAEAKSLSVQAFRKGGLNTKSWEEYYKGLLVDPVEYWKQHFAGKTLFRYIQSHPDMDHMGGLFNLLWGEKVPLENFWDIRNSKAHEEGDFESSPYAWEDWLAYKVARQGVGPGDTTHKVHTKLRGHTGDYWTGDGLRILNPTTDLTEYCDKIENWNNGSYVLALEHGGRRVILPGDAEKPAWDSMEADLGDSGLKCDVLKAAHHGRESGYSETAVDLMDPSVVICSVGKKPSTDASDEYRSHGAQVLSTRFYGTITMTMWLDGSIWIDDYAGKRITSFPKL